VTLAVSTKTHIFSLSLRSKSKRETPKITLFCAHRINQENLNYLAQTMLPAWSYIAPWLPACKVGQSSWTLSIGPYQLGNLTEMICCSNTNWMYENECIFYRFLVLCGAQKVFKNVIHKIAVNDALQKH